MKTMSLKERNEKYLADVRKGKYRGSDSEKVDQYKLEAVTDKILGEVKDAVSAFLRDCTADHPEITEEIANTVDAFLNARMGEIPEIPTIIGRWIDEDLDLIPAVDLENAREDWEKEGEELKEREARAPHCKACGSACEPDRVSDEYLCVRCRHAHAWTLICGR